MQNTLHTQDYTHTDSSFRLMALSLMAGPNLNPNLNHTIRKPDGRPRGGIPSLIPNALEPKVISRLLGDEGISGSELTSPEP